MRRFPVRSLLPVWLCFLPVLTSSLASAAGDDLSSAPAETASADPEEALKAPPVTDYYVDPSRGPTRFSSEYELWFGDERRSVHYVRAVAELAGVLGIGTGYYWINSNPNKQDWDYLDPADRAAHVDVKFDNNMFLTNFMLHPFAGSMSYWLSRSNGIDVYLSSLNSMLSSAMFEFVLEWLEKPSINDLMATPMGGIAAGEFFFHLSDYLNSAYPHASFVQQALGLSLGAPEALHGALDGRHAPAGPKDGLGYGAAYWHAFDVGYGMAGVANEAGGSGTVHDLLFGAKLIAIPGFMKPGHFDVHFHNGNFTAARLRTSVADALLKDVDLSIRSDLVGRYRQDYEGAEGALNGVATMYAASVDLRYVDRWIMGRRDQWAFFHFLGPSARVWWGFGNGFLAHVEGGLHLDFAGISSPAYGDYVQEEGAAGTKTVLQLQNYYSGIGASGRLAGSVSMKGVELKGYARYGSYRSIDGLDRYYTPRDALNTDQIIELGAGVSYSPPTSPLSFEGGWGSIEHRSQMGTASVDWRDTRLSLSGAIGF